MARSSSSRRSAAARKAANDRRRKHMWLGELGAAGAAVLAAVVVTIALSGNPGSLASTGESEADHLVANFSFTLFQGENRNPQDVSTADAAGHRPAPV